MEERDNQRLIKDYDNITKEKTKIFWPSPRVNYGRSICEPASHASLAFKFKHPFQIELIKSI